MSLSPELTDAQHEAAHVVVGAALGLRLSRAWIGREPDGTYGWTEWEREPFTREADLIMTAAGIAWERRCGDLEWAGDDLRYLRRKGIRGNARVTVLERAAWAILETRAQLHTKVTRALLDGPLTLEGLKRIAARSSDDDLL
jgi:hypothetical protein